ncbi:MAG: GHKL domain-containing protein, partial [Schaedlerella arabinosiphila]|nr:GHKL domain-containing protein [Schaedlerella arabinosiphila]
EVRRFRHDFKNMMSGMYMQAKEGDLEAIQSYIQEMTSDFDMQVGSQIRIMNQLANIRVAEVKGLFLEKLKVMQEEEIHCELEVLKPFEKTGLRSTDLCRCLGILLDNAMEEVRGKKDGKIHVMISSQSGCTTFRVKNTMHSSVDFHKIGTLGYSTKGENRGIGLANYKKILERYDRILPLTTIQDGFFIQELKVQES